MEKIKIKILGFSCGDKKGGNTAWIVQYSLKAIEKFGRRINQIADIETEFIDLADKDIKPCPYGDEYWKSPEPGMFLKGENDYFDEEIEPKVVAADGFIFGSSVHNASFSSKFKLLVERFYPLTWKGYLTNKTAASIAVGYGALWGLETCLQDMNNCLRALEMIVCTRLTGCPISTGPRVGKEGDVISTAKKDRYGQWLAVNQARRAAEVAIKQKLARRWLGDIYVREFVQLYHLSDKAKKTWSWWKLDKEEEEYMMSL